MSQIFAKRLKSERQKNGWTQAFMANKLGLSNGALSGYKRNYREPDLNMLRKISVLLNVSSDYLLGETDQRRFTDSLEKIPHTAPVLDEELDTFYKVKLLSKQSQKLIREQINHLYHLEKTKAPKDDGEKNK